MKSIRVEGTLTEDRTLLLEDLPFPPGATVAVIIEQPLQPSAALEAASSGEQRYTLRGTVLRYEDPFTPAAPEQDWNALRTP